MGIHPENGEKEIFKWFLASILFGARISEKIAIATYHQFDAQRLTDPKKILDAGWDSLVECLDSGGYVRYDFKTADKLLEMAKNFLRLYGGMDELYRQSPSGRDLENNLKDLGKGIGNVTVNIFLRDLRDVWDKANPLPQGFTILAAENLGFIERGIDRGKSLEKLKDVWKENEIPGYGFPDFEDSLFKLGKDYCRKNRCDRCEMREDCKMKNK
jgi:endonuclease III